MSAALGVSLNGSMSTPVGSSPPGPRATRWAELAAKVAQVHARIRGTYGSPRIHQQLQRDSEAVSEKTIAKVMKTVGVQGISLRRS